MAVLPAPQRRGQARSLLLILAIVALILLLVPRFGSSGMVTVTQAPAPSANVVDAT